jgi:hypothetical protein
MKNSYDRILVVYLYVRIRGQVRPNTSSDLGPQARESIAFNVRCSHQGKFSMKFSFRMHSKEGQSATGIFAFLGPCNFILICWALE